jgi:hypothetical protein
LSAGLDGLDGKKGGKASKSELEKTYATARKQTFTVTTGRAPEYLEQAEELLDKASHQTLQAIVPRL